MVLRTILLVGLLALLVPAEARSPHPPPVRRIHHPSRSRLSILPRIPPSTNPLSRPRSLLPPSPHPRSLLHSDTILLSLSLPDLLPFEASLFLRPTEHLFHPDAKETRDGVQVGKLNRADWRLYTGDVVHPQWVDRIMAEETSGHGFTSGNGRMGSANIMVHHPGGDGVDPVFEGSFVIDGVTYHVLTRDKYLRLRKPGDVEVEDFSDMVVFRDIDMFDDAPVTSAHTCSHDSLPHNNNMSHPIWRNRHAEVFTPFPPHGGDIDEIKQFDLWKRDDTGGMTGSSNFINSINSTSGCPSTTQIVYMGVALDCNYVATYGSTDAARSQVLNDWNQISALYKSTFNISLGIIELTVMNGSCPSTAVSGQAWNVGCDKNLTLDQRLSDFSQWRGNKGDDGVGLWHLMSACPTDSEVGVAWLGTLCQQSATQQSSSYVSGTGISTATKTEWSLVAHEIGHGFGAIHDCTSGCSLSGQCCPLTQSTCNAGGSFIMNPTTSSTEIKFSGCTLGNICSNIGTRAISSSCIQSPSSDVTIISLQQCGNGIVEAGEQCDPGSNSTSACCDPSTCKFRSGAVCDPSNSACCTGACQYASSGTVCRPAVDAQCDYAEVCSGSNATCPADKTAPDGQSCGSSGEACASGTCTSLNLQCQSAGASMNLTTACGQRDDTSCVVTCKSPNVTNQCVVLQTPLVDGSPCGYGGHCYNQTCQAGSWEATFDSWYTSNLQISIPVTIVVGLIVLLAIFLITRGIIRCVRGPKAAPAGRRRGANRSSQLPPPPPMRQSAYNPNLPPPVMAHTRHADSVSSQDPITSTRVMDREPSPNPSGGSGIYGNGGYDGANRYSGGYGGNGTDQGGYLHPHQGPAQDFSRTHGGWVDERAYNGPYYGRNEAFGR